MKKNFPSPFYRWRPHPWHGLEIGPNPPAELNAYIELTPFDRVKYEIDKETGYIMVDRPQRTSSQPPSLYGFIPRTYCGDRVGAIMEGAEKGGDGDPLDICVLSERPIQRGEIIVRARVVGGLPMLDDGEADDKIIAVLINDLIWTDIEDISDLPPVLVERLRHYFLTYKLIPGQESKTSIGKSYGKEEALKVIEASMQDYEDEYGSD
ncbi:MAG: inorganic pyrophosphatase [Verrucomicrobiales bacterium]|nr:inorganic pyrophosphatase [Verrucomicrobiales bacterium]